MTHSKIVHVLICVIAQFLLVSPLNTVESYYIPNFITVSRTILNVMEEYFHMLMIQPGMKPKLPLGFLSAFCPNGGVGKMRLYGLLRGQVHICVQSMWQTIGGSGDMLLREILNLDILLDAIWRTLGLFLHKYNLPFIVSFYKGLN